MTPRINVLALPGPVVDVPISAAYRVSRENISVTYMLSSKVIPVIALGTHVDTSTVNPLVFV